MTKQKIKLIFVMFTVIVLGALIGIVLNSSRQYFDANKRLQEEQAKLQLVKNEISEIKKAIVRYEDEKKEFEQYLFDEQDIPAFLDEISKMAQKTDVNITNMKTKSFREVKKSIKLNEGQSRAAQKRRSKKQQQQAEEKQLKKMLTLAAMPIKMKVEGEFESILKYFNSVEEFKQLVTISNVEIVSGREYPTLKCEYTLKIYSLKVLSEIETK